VVVIVTSHLTECYGHHQMPVAETFRWYQLSAAKSCEWTTHQKNVGQRLSPSILKWRMGITCSHPTRMNTWSTHAVPRNGECAATGHSIYFFLVFCFVLLDSFCQTLGWLSLSPAWFRLVSQVCSELFHVTVIVMVDFVLLSEHKFICYKQEAWKLGLDQYPN